MYALGIDVGSSSVKVSAVNLDTSESVGVAQYPKEEMSMLAVKPGWAEQDPDLWWQCACDGIRDVLASNGISPAEVGSIGIAYQMHGLVLIDKDGDVLRPSIIWCDSRAVEIGNEAFETLGHEFCLSHCLNSPGNFTASKLRWVKDNEPELYERIDKIMLPGDYIAFKLTGEAKTTISGLSEGVMWDFSLNAPSKEVLDYMGVKSEFLPEINQSIGNHGTVTNNAAQESGLIKGIPVTYRAGDQPNNAMSLGVLNPGQIAATGGTSGVVYAVSDKATYDSKSRVNGFAHVNHTPDVPRVGILLCINGTGILHSWMRNNVAKEISYPDMESLAALVEPGTDGLIIVPFGNGAERILENRDTGVHIGNLQLNRHGQAHLVRAGLEGIAFSFVYGFEIMKEMGVKPDVIRVGNDNLFQSKIFAQTVTNLLDCPVEVVNTTGATGAARASAVATGVYSSLEEAMAGLQTVAIYRPGQFETATMEHYRRWVDYLERILA